MSGGTTGLLIDGTDVGDLCRELEELGADVVGLNCSYGPDTMLPFMQRVKDKCKVRIETLVKMSKDFPLNFATYNFFLLLCFQSMQVTVTSYGS